VCFVSQYLSSWQVKPHKLKRHVETKHSEMKSKPQEYFHRKPDETRTKQKCFVNTTAGSSDALLATYEMLYRIAQNKKPPTIAETVILLAAIDTLQPMFGEKCAQQFRNISLSNNTISLWIPDITEDFDEQLIEELREVFQYRLTKWLIVVILFT
jgi:hypothetical protein